jgi:hypothetical protein
LGTGPGKDASTIINIKARRVSAQGVGDFVGCGNHQAALCGEASKIGRV